MPFQNQFALSLELTKFLPLGPIVNASGEAILKIARELRRSGSDIVVEEDLAAVFGRNRIEPHFESSFKTAVRSSEIHPISKYLDIVLEAGAGPTVRRSLNDRARFSTVVQLSLLVYTHKIHDLANGLSRALEKRLEGSNTEMSGSTVDYEGLAGTLETCGDQTSGYRWHLLLDAVEDTMPLTRSDHIEGLCTEPFATLGHDPPEAAPQVGRQLGDKRGLDYVVLQGLLDLLTCVQYLPEDRIITIRCTKGISTIVVWAHHVLGLTVEVSRGDRSGSTTFGLGQANLIIESSVPPSVALLDAVDSEQFCVVGDAISEPVLTGRTYWPLLGSGVRVLEIKLGNIADIDVKELAALIFSNCLRSWLKWLDCHYEPRGNTKPRIQEAVQIIFDIVLPTESLAVNIEGSSTEATSIWIQQWASKQNGKYGIDTVPPWVVEGCILRLESLAIALSRISTIHGCHELPISADALLSQRALERLNLATTFAYWCNIMGRDKSQDRYIERASAFAAQGWTVLSGIIGCLDPSDHSACNIAIIRGVPSRCGERKHWIVDGTVSTSHDVDDLIAEPPGSTSDLRCSNVISGPKQFLAVRGPTFEIVQMYQMIAADETQTQRLGFRQMLDALSMAVHLKPCEHPQSDKQTVVLPPNTLTFHFSFMISDVFVNDDASINTALGLSAGVPAARWVLLSSAVAQKSYHGYTVYIRGPDCCYSCAVQQAFQDEIKSVVVL
ncbi:MAG: hypothetical protein M1812_003116 [Candelaria pacifica]|nr:MAG: hypothetical protein M1812_003116 [Candelaria pacifica]